MKRTRVGLVLGATAYVLAFYAAYIYAVFPRYAYLGYINNPISPLLSLVIVILAATPSLWMPIELRRPSQVIYWFIYMLVYVPASIVPFLTLGQTPWESYLLFDLTLLACIALAGVPYLFPRFRVPRAKLSPRAFWISAGTLSLGLYALVIKSFGWHFHLISIWQVYDLRADYKGMVDSAPRLAVYAVTWLSDAINPFFIANGIVRKSFALLLLGILGQLLIYSITGFKTVLFSAVLLGALVIPLRNRGKSFGLIMIFGAVGLTVLSLLESVLAAPGIVTALFTQRMVATPGLLTGFYYEFFSTHAHGFLGYGILKHFVPYPYSLTPPFIIGTQYFHNPSTSANANFWADGYANFGLLGVWGFTLLLAYLLWTIDSVASDLETPLVTLAIGLSGITLANSALLTSLFTNGLLFIILLIFFAPRPGRPGVPTLQELGRQPNEQL